MQYAAESGKTMKTFRVDRDDYKWENWKNSKL